MAKSSKKFAEASKQLEKGKAYTLAEAVDLVKRLSYAKFDETVEVHFHLGIDCKKSDQNIRGTIVLPNGTGKTLRICVITKEDKIDPNKSALDFSASPRIDNGYVKVTAEEGDTAYSDWYGTAPYEYVDPNAATS